MVFVIIAIIVMIYSVHTLTWEMRINLYTGYCVS